MPDSLLTTKRKFYKFLDQLSAPPSAPSDTKKRPLSTSSARDNSVAAPQPLDLEARLAQRAAKRLRPSTSSASLASYRARLSNPPPALSHGPRAHNASPSARSSSSSSSQKGASSVVVLVGNGGAGEEDDEKKKTTTIPSFNPWSHDAFLARLRSFAPVTDWLPKPDERVGEVPWAKRGWACVAAETVGCRTCGRRVVVDFRGPKFDGRGRLRRRGGAEGEGAEEEVEGEEGREFGSARIEVPAGLGEDEDEQAHAEDEDDSGNGEEDEAEYEEAFERGLVEKYAALIVEGHAEGCLWRRTGCKDDIYRLPVVRSAWWQAQVKSAFNSAVATSDEFKGVKIRAIDGGHPSVDVMLRDLPTTFFATGKGGGNEATDIDKETKQTALTVALTGWHVTTESSTHLLSCSACFQRIGLWMYAQPSTPSTSVPAEDEGGDDEEGSRLDLVEQHREHCPWRSPASQHAVGDYTGWPAWRILWDVVGRYAAEQRRRSRDRYGAAAAAAEQALADGLDEGATADPRANDAVGLGEGGDGEGTVMIVREGREWERREETARLDRERTNKLRRLKRVLGFKFRMPAGVGRKEVAAATGNAAESSTVAPVVTGESGG